MQHKNSPRDRIVASAKQLFSERGFHRTAVADLAEDAQVSVGTIYRSFANKSDIIRAIVDADTQETLAQLQADIDQVRAGTITGGAALERMIVEWASKSDDALNHEIIAEGHRNPEVAETIATVCGQFREQFRTLARLIRPDLDEVNTEGASEILLTCLFSMGNRDFTHPRLTVEQTAAVVTRLLVEGMRNAQT